MYCRIQTHFTFEKLQVCHRLNAFHIE